MTWLNNCNRYQLVGVIFIISFSVINAIKSVLEGALLVNISPEFLAFNTLFLAQLYYLFLHKDKKSLWGKIKKEYRLVFMHNVTTLVSWLGVLYALSALSPLVANCLIVGMEPLATIAMMPFFGRQTNKLRRELIAGAGCLAAVLYLIYVSYAGHSALSHITYMAVVIGVAASGLTAIGLSGTVHVTKSLSERSFTSADMMTYRFTLLNLVCFMYLMFHHSWAVYTVNLVLIMVLLTVVGILFAIYFLQVGIARVSPTTVSFLCTTGLVFTFLFQFFNPHLTVSYYSLYGMLALVVFTLYGTIDVPINFKNKETGPEGEIL